MLRSALAIALLLATHVAQAVDEFGYRVLEKRPHSRSDFVQGLEIRGDRLYQGTGRYGHSRLQVFSFPEGSLLKEVRLPSRYFGEGVTVLGDHAYQLTWRQGKALVYDRDTLALQREFPVDGEGWGLTNNGSELILSDGSATLRVLDPADGRVLRRLQVSFRGRPLPNLNELEWTPDSLLANVWRSDWIVMIDHNSGAVTGRISLSGLLPRRERRPGTDVLNGIAVDPRSGDLWVTGKNWPWLYRIELVRESALE